MAARRTAGRIGVAGTGQVARELRSRRRPRLQRAVRRGARRRAEVDQLRAGRRRPGAAGRSAGSRVQLPRPRRLTRNPSSRSGCMPTSLSCGSRRARRRARARPAGGCAAGAGRPARAAATRGRGRRTRGPRRASAELPRQVRSGDGHGHQATISRVAMITRPVHQGRTQKGPMIPPPDPALRRVHPLRPRPRHGDPAGLGLDPWDVFHQGVASHTGLSFGTS